MIALGWLIQDREEAATSKRTVLLEAPDWMSGIRVEHHL
jgi:hypothetical protein